MYSWSVYQCVRCTNNCFLCMCKRGEKDIPQQTTGERTELRSGSVETNEVMKVPLPMDTHLVCIGMRVRLCCASSFRIFNNKKIPHECNGSSSVEFIFRQLKIIRQMYFRHFTFHTFCQTLKTHFIFYVRFYWIFRVKSFPLASKNRRVESVSNTIFPVVCSDAWRKRCVWECECICVSKLIKSVGIWILERSVLRARVQQRKTEKSHRTNYTRREKTATATMALRWKMYFEMERMVEEISLYISESVLVKYSPLSQSLVGNHTLPSK